MTEQPSTEQPAGPGVLLPGIPRWAIHRRMYEWVLSFAHSRYSGGALFVLAFAESSFFPVPPDVLQVALTLERRARAFYYAAISAAGSVLGGLAGYAIGWGAWAAVDDLFFRYIISPEAFAKVEGLYQEYDFWAVFIAAFTPIPYKVFTIAGGVFHISLPMFVLGSLVGRSARFFLVALLLYAFGPPMKRFVERYFDLLSIVFVVVLVGGFALYKVLE